MMKTPVTSRSESGDLVRISAELRRPEAYSRAVEEVGFLQTHISWLFFAGDRVYKVKKPVDLGFLDFTTLDRRRHFCEEEVRLNKRLSPQVYFGVVPITRSLDGHLHVDGHGEAVEWAVEMVRLPEQRMFSSLLDRAEIDNAQMNAMAALLARFHADCPTGPGIDEHGSPAAITRNVEENFEQLREFVDDCGKGSSSGIHVLSSRQYDFLKARRQHYLESHVDILERRVEEHRIREGHGDLHAGNVCFTDDGIAVYDCIEFNRRFRCGDVAADLAFLAMDLDYRGYPGFSKYFVRQYSKITNDPELPELENFYKGYRAIVRGKVAALTCLDPELEDSRREELRRKAMRYVFLASAYELPPAMILMCGLPACGKSWLAKRLAGSLRAAVLQSDVRRKTLSGIAPTSHVKEEYESGLYSPRRKELTYRSLLDGALGILKSGHSVIVDATFSRQKYRSSFIDAAARLDLPYYVVHVAASDQVIRERLEQRKNEKRQASDADLDVYLRARTSFEPPIEVPRGHVLEVVSGEGVPEEQCSTVIDGMIAIHEERAKTTAD